MRADESGASGWLNGGLGGGQKNQVSQAAPNQAMARTTRRLIMRLPIPAPTHLKSASRTMPERSYFRHAFAREGVFAERKFRSAQKKGDLEKTP